MFAAWTYFVSQPSIVLSCKEGKVLGFSNQAMPGTFFVEPDSCNGFIEVRDQNGTLICKNYDFSKLSQEETKVACQELKNEKNKLLEIKFETYSSLYGNFTGKTEITYE